MNIEGLLITFAIPIIGAAVLLLSWHYFFAKRKPRPKKEAEAKEGEIPKGPPVRVRVYNCESRMVSNQDMPLEAAEKIKEKHGSLGRQWLRFNEKVYALMLKDGKYSPAPLGASTGDAKQKIISPRVIGRALAVGYSIALFYRVQMPQSMSGNMKQILWWSGILAVIIFLIVKG